VSPWFPSRSRTLSADIITALTVLPPSHTIRVEEEDSVSRTVPPYVPGHQLLEGKTVLVTAAAGAGIGFAAAQRCAEEGATVMISDIHERRLGEAAEALGKIAGTRPASLLCNVAREEEVQQLIRSAVSEMGHIDVLINNAGLGGTTPIVDMTDDQWYAVIETTLTGTFRMTRAVLPHMMQRGRGSIVNNASVLGWRAQAGQAHYAAAKAGVMALTRCAALEAAPAGVRVNAVSPSLAPHKFLSKVIPEEVLRDLESREAFGRGAEPWEVANVMVFLASDYSSYMTGEVVSVSSQHA
jgi:3-oxoacyl-[acyl-carrier protein] reductase